MKTKLKNYTLKLQGQNLYIINIQKEYNFDLLLGIKPNNKNFQTLVNIGELLNKTNKEWMDLFIFSEILERNWNTYLKGHEYISLLTIERIIGFFNNEIKSPREIIDLNRPVLKGGKTFELNIKEIMERYTISRKTILKVTGMDGGTLTNYINGKNKQLRIETLDKLYNFFKSQNVPLKHKADLIYFPMHGESPLHFLPIEKKAYKPLSKIRGNNKAKINNMFF